MDNKYSEYTKPIIGALVIAVFIIIAAYINLRLTTPVVPIEMPTATSTPDVVTPPSSVLYEDINYGYSLEYPVILDKSENQHKASNDFDGIKADTLFTASFPEGFEKGTNLTSATLFAGIRDVKKGECHSKIYGGSVASSSARISPTPVSIGDIDFSVVSISDPGAGNLYVTTRYTTLHNNLCYSVGVVAHSFNDIETYNEDHKDAPIERYDQYKIDAVLDKVVQSFSFTK